MKLFDAHCHLQDERLYPQLAQVMQRAFAAGVRRMMCCGSNEEDWETVQSITSQYPGVLSSFGLHPRYMADKTPQWLERLEQLLIDNQAGLGEIGLDYAFSGHDAAEQEQVFVGQLRLAGRLKLPVSIHCRKAWDQMLLILKREGGTPWGGILHTYSGPAGMVGPFEEMGLYLSFGGLITRKNSKNEREAAKMVSAERLLMETDSPDLTPQGAPGKINEPANLILVAQVLAAVRDAPVAVVAEQAYVNACQIFAEIKST